MDPGPPDEEDQELEFRVSLDNPADDDAFLVPPQISPDGTLSFTAVSLVLATPRVIPLTVVLEDDAGGVSDQVQFTITLTPLTGP